MGHVWETVWDLFGARLGHILGYFPALFGIPKTLHQCSIMGVFSKYRFWDCFGTALGESQRRLGYDWETLGKACFGNVRGTFGTWLGHVLGHAWSIIVTSAILASMAHIWGTQMLKFDFKVAKTR